MPKEPRRAQGPASRSGTAPGPHSHFVGQPRVGGERHFKGDLRPGKSEKKVGGLEAALGPHLGQQGRDSIPLSLTCCRYRRRPPTRQPPRRPSLLLPLAELPTARLTESYELKMSCEPLRGSEWGTRFLCLFSAERGEAEAG